jgi:hypothetical protein
VKSAVQKLPSDARNVVFHCAMAVKEILVNGITMKNLENDFVDRLMYVFKAPIIVWPGSESDITEEMHSKSTLYRLALIATAQKLIEATEYEAMLYIMTASLANPLAHSATKIYGSLFCKFYPNNAGLMEGLEKPSEWELQDLKRLQQWIFKQQIKTLKEKEKAEKQKIVLPEEKTVQLTFPFSQ